MDEDRFHRKRGPTYYPPDTVARAREHAERFDWARERRDDAVAEAEAFLDQHGGLEGIWSFVTGQQIPRSCAVSDAGSPITGEELIREHGGRAWIADGSYGRAAATFDGIDPAPGPWTLVDPTSGYVFPTNDFAAYRESGLDKRGFFDRELADDSLLVNDRYPDKPVDWGVDDGWGWTDAEGHTYTFVAFYNHFHVWYEIRFMARAFRDAYLLTDDPRYARAGTVLVDRVADAYPDLDISVWGPDTPFANSHGGWGQGKEVGGMAWGNTNVRAYMSCYDGVFAGQPDADVVPILEELTAGYGLGDKSSLAAVRQNIEEGIVSAVLPNVRDGVLRGGWGHHQRSLALSAVVQDEPDAYSRDAVEFLLKAGEPKHFDDGTPWGQTIVTGGDLMPRIVDAFDRDGHYRLSVFYNKSKPVSIQQLAELLDHVPGDVGPNLIDHPKAERIHHARIPLVALNRYMPNIGDTEKTGEPVVNLDRDHLVETFLTYDDPRVAQALAVVTNTDGLDRYDDVFSDHAGRLRDQVVDVLDARGPLDLPSTNLAGYGLAMLRQGTIEPRPSTKRVAWVYYGRNGGYGHNHRDMLTLGLFGAELDLLPDLGYPEKAVAGYPKRDFTKGTISHNTVTVDAEDQAPIWVGEPRHYEDTDLLSFIDVSAPDVYPQADVYRRTTAMVRIDADASYLVDVFRVEGGDDHRFSFHAAEGEMGARGLDLDDQGRGTYADPDVPLPERGENPPYHDEVGNGFNYLANVRRDRDPSPTFDVTWDIEDSWDVRDDGAADIGLRLTMFGEYDEVALADGEPPQKPGAPDRLGYVLARRTGEDLASIFTSVIEPFEGESRISSIEVVPVTSPTDANAAGRAVRVELADGPTDYIAISFAPGSELTVGNAFAFDGFLAMYREADGEPRAAYLMGGRRFDLTDGAEPLVDRASGRIEGSVVECSREWARDNRITVRPDAGIARMEETEGSWVYVETVRRENGAYEIQDVTIEGDIAHLDVGDRTTIAAYADPDDRDAGFEYVIAPGDRFTIPLGEHWSAPE